MVSEEVWAIEELVRIICSHTLEYQAVSLWDDYEHDDDLVLGPWSRRTLARCVVLNHFISRIAVNVLWREISSLKPLCALLPPDYCRKVEHFRLKHVSFL